MNNKIILTRMDNLIVAMYELGEECGMRDNIDIWRLFYRTMNDLEDLLNPDHYAT